MVDNSKEKLKAEERKTSSILNAGEGIKSQKGK